MFLEGAKPSDELKMMESERQRLKLIVYELERKLDAEDTKERLTSVMNNISSRMTRYIKNSLTIATADMSSIATF